MYILDFLSLVSLDLLGIVLYPLGDFFSTFIGKSSSEFSLELFCLVEVPTKEFVGTRHRECYPMSRGERRLQNLSLRMSL